MSILEPKYHHSEKSESELSGTDSYDSEDDPNFDILEETKSCFSKLSINKKAKRRCSISKEMNNENEEVPERIVPELDKKEQKCYDIVQQIIEVGQVDKLKVDQCKLYLRKNGLKLTGNKDILIGRIKEQLDSGGEKTYSMASITVNCKENDPSFDIFEASQASYSKSSIKEKNKSGISSETDEESEEETELILPDLDEKDEKSYEIVQKIIEVAQIDKLKVDQCKLYLRKNGLRLTGNKETLIGRIIEHRDTERMTSVYENSKVLNESCLCGIHTEVGVHDGGEIGTAKPTCIVSSGGEKKYPASSFTLNCKGDACTGDVVMFEQNVYEMFNIASRSATGPPCGRRIVTGRIVKESYGAAKQQHTFTIEVLWSKGEKPLPPLHPLLIKGRNLYKLKTMRQKWQDEGERQKILLEKHNRGSVARLNRDTRIQEKEMRKMLKANRPKMDYQGQKLKVNTSKALPSKPFISGQQRLSQNKQPDLQPAVVSINVGNDRQQLRMQKTSQVENIRQKELQNSKAPAPSRGTCFSNGNVPSEQVFTRQPLAAIYPNFYVYGQNINANYSKSPLIMLAPQQTMNSNLAGVQFHQASSSLDHLAGAVRNHGSQASTGTSVTQSASQRQKNNQKQVCQYYPKGRCYFGDRCKYLHENHS